MGNDDNEFMSFEIIERLMIEQLNEEEEEE